MTFCQPTELTEVRTNNKYPAIKKGQHSIMLLQTMCVCVCVWERERVRERVREFDLFGW